EPVDVPVEPAGPGHAPEASPDEREAPLDPTSTQQPIATPDRHATDEDDTAPHADPTWPDQVTDQVTEQETEPTEGQPAGQADERPDDQPEEQPDDPQEDPQEDR